MSLRFTFYAFAIFASLIFLVATPAHAMPEYAARVGEPCASCHLSPAGGGLRNVRGQAWVASDKPGTVPSTADALKILGIVMPADMSIYTSAPTHFIAPVPLQTQIKYSALLDHLTSYEGN